jgi:hypothetical protein
VPVYYRHNLLTRKTNHETLTFSFNNTEKTKVFLKIIVGWSATPFKIKGRGRTANKNANIPITGGAFPFSLAHCV